METYFRCIFHGSVCLIKLNVIGETDVRYFINPDSAEYVYGYEIPGRIIGKKVKKEDCYNTLELGINAVNKHIRNRMKSIKKQIKHFEEVCECTAGM